MAICCLSFPTFAVLPSIIVVLFLTESRFSITVCIFYLVILCCFYYLLTLFFHFLFCSPFDALLWLSNSISYFISYIFRNLIFLVLFVVPCPTFLFFLWFYLLFPLETHVLFHSLIYLLIYLFIYLVILCLVFYLRPSPLPTFFCSVFELYLFISPESTMSYFPLGLAFLHPDELIFFSPLLRLPFFFLSTRTIAQTFFNGFLF